MKVLDSTGIFRKAVVYSHFDVRIQDEFIFAGLMS